MIAEQQATSSDEPIIRVSNLSFAYPLRDSEQRSLSLNDVTLDVPRGARVVVLGANGSGKSTLLRIIGGRHFVSPECCTVFGRSAFHDTALLSEMVYLGDWWRRDYIGIPVREVLATHLANPATSERVLYLASLFEVELDWPVSMLSDGERRRVQIVAGLAQQKSLYLLDEITAELDLLSRVSLLRYLFRESEQRRATVLLATHIFDDVGFLAPTHVLRTQCGRAAFYDAAKVLSCVDQDIGTASALLGGSLEGCAHPDATSPTGPSAEGGSGQGSAVGAFGVGGVAARVGSPSSQRPHEAGGGGGDGAVKRDRGSGEMGEGVGGDGEAAMFGRYGIDDGIGQGAGFGDEAVEVMRSPLLRQQLAGGEAGSMTAVVGVQRRLWYKLAQRWLREDHAEVRAVYKGIPWQMRGGDLKVK